MLKKWLNGVVAQRQSQRRADLYRNLIRHEAKIGGQIFGPIPNEVRREFFCLDKNTWIWHEEWNDQSGQRQARTTRYDIRPDGMVIKAQDGHPYQEVGYEEALRLCDAAEEYERRINRELYSFAV